MAPRSSKPRVKICGITRAEDAHAAVELGVHALGFIFHHSSPRYVTPEVAASIINTLPPFVTAVGVFVNRSRTDIEKIVAVAGLHMIQLHGEESPDDCKGYSRPVIKALRLSMGKPLPILAAYPVSGLLVEPQVSEAWGGTGIPLDWERLKKDLEPETPAVRSRLVLAGGLDPQNVALAASIVQPYAVDVSTGVEDEPGIKNHKKIEEFMNALYG
ncbi:MAG: phosphoribosylanthranilate isomerase [Desulfomonilaceae bacterium]